MEVQKMSGQLIFRTRSGTSLDKRFERYPEWYLEVIGEDKISTQLSPTYDDLNTLFHEIFIHEFLNDWMRERRPPDYTVKRIKFGLPVLLDFAQTDFENHWKDPMRIPLIYHQCNYSNDWNW
jgi:hypothetical protein